MRVNNIKKVTKEKIKGKKQIKLSNIHKGEPYSPAMFCKDFDRSLDTLKQYEKEGLQINHTEEGSYFMGYELYKFLKHKRKKKITSKGKTLAQFRCVRCRKLVNILNNQIVIKPGKIYWSKSNTRQLILVGICKECNRKTYQFSSTKYLKEIKEIFNVVRLLD